MNRNPWIICLNLVVIVIALCVNGALAKEPVRLILDTDIEGDVDDVGSVAVLHALADRGEVEILGMAVSTKHSWSVPCLDALNTYYGRPNIPIGAPKAPGGAPEMGSPYTKAIADEYPHQLKSPDDALDAVTLYRQILATQPDQSVVIVTIGYLTNLANLLKSQGDAASDLNGMELVKKKVRIWVCMGGTFLPAGIEYNIKQDAAAGVEAVRNWPTPVVFSGFEIGNAILTGPKLAATPKDNPVRRAYELYNGLTNRPSWDQTAVLYAVRGLNGGLADFWDIRAPGIVRINADGSSFWEDSPNGKHAYLVQKMPPAEVASAIESLMLQPPAKLKPSATK